MMLKPSKSKKWLVLLLAGMFMFTSAQMTRAAPAAVYGHNASRINYDQLGQEGIYGSNPIENNDWYDALNYGGNLKVLMGAGHPDDDNDNRLNPAVSDKYVGRIRPLTSGTDHRRTAGPWLKPKRISRPLPTAISIRKSFSVSPRSTPPCSRAGPIWRETLMRPTPTFPPLRP